MGKVLAATFKWLYTWFHDCSRDADKENISEIEEGSSLQLPRTKKKIIVPSTACLWVISFYIAGGTITFKAWEGWDYWDSVYFVVISLCKVGFGDFVPGSSTKDSEVGSQSKLVINFIFLLFGMALVAMCYILMREEVREKLHEIKEDAKMCMEDISQKFVKCFGNSNRYDDELEERY
jgi:potassium channel subfamily K, invertebrate